MTNAGAASGTGTSIAIPTHVAGDLILIFTRGTAAAPSVPAASGTVPQFTIMGQSALSNSLGTTVCVAHANAANHTSGTWTNATHIAVLVLRPATGKALTFGANPLPQAANNTQTVVYPALTRQVTDGSSFGVRFGTRTVAVTALANPPAGWTNMFVQPPGSAALMTVHTLASLASDPTLDSVTVTSSNAPYRGHTIEILEVTPNETLIDDFNRADGQVDVGAGGVVWSSTGLKGEAYTMLIRSNAVQLSANGADPLTLTCISKASLQTSFDLLIDCVGAPDGSPAIEFQFSITNPGSSRSGYSFDLNATTWDFIRWDSGGPTTVVASPMTMAAPAVGDTIWIRKRGTATSAWVRRSGASVFTRVVAMTDSTYNLNARFAVEISNTRTVRWDNLRGGPMYVPPQSVVVI